ncbi:MAG TPA: glucose-6-phosphate dehydrogenase assembly protein OpcA [Verrucomicrobiae bacterium]|nr:glucose-6-phosphate dehydrogenase assembly protein OpcA [Verrucomicrobiae bacterium]
MPTNAQIETFAAGVETAVDVAQIERQLHELWQAAAESGQDSSGRQIARSCLFSFVVYCGTESERDHATQTIGMLTPRHPCRAIVLWAQPDTPQTELSATISAHCHVAGGGRKQVCCEQIAIRASGSDVEKLKAVVLPLLESDLPTVIWWPGNFLQQRQSFRRLMDVADRILYDTSSWNQPYRQLCPLADMIAENRRCLFADLSWTRLDLWRQLAADFFDDPLCQKELGKIRAVEIEHGCGPGAGVRARLLASWFAAQLEWPVSDAQAKLRLTEKEERDASAVGIRSFTIRTDDATFSIRKNHGELTATALAVMPNVCGVPRKRAFRPMDDASLLSQELDHSLRHAIYERSLTMASRLFRTGAF